MSNLLKSTGEGPSSLRRVAVDFHVPDGVEVSFSGTRPRNITLRQGEVVLRIPIEGKTVSDLVNAIRACPMRVGARLLGWGDLPCLRLDRVDMEIQKGTKLVWSVTITPHEVSEHEPVVHQVMDFTQNETWDQMSMIQVGVEVKL